jgi:hypothetical protein
LPESHIFKYMHNKNRFFIDFLLNAFIVIKTRQVIKKFERIH